MTINVRTLALLAAAALLACDEGGSVNDDGLSSDGLDAGPDAPSGPLANVYNVNPVEDGKKTSVVTLQHLTDPGGKLSGKYADVWNCLNEPGGDTFNVTLGGMPVSGSVCHLVQKATADKNGTYLDITPPASDDDGNDSFAEVMMYHHVTTIHDHYAEGFGLKHLESTRMRSLVNVQVLFLGQWVGILNAAYFPKETGSLFAQFGVDLNKGEDAIIFSQDTMDSTVDTAYDASVIYHEYTHAAIGSSALWKPATDKHGMDPSPKGLNEALADYLAASFIGSPTIGSYSLAALGADRDLTRVFKCPDHLVGEEHTDGEIASGALWSLRQVLGPKVADQAIWNAVLTFGEDTTFEEASLAIIDEVKKAAPGKEPEIQKILQERGMLGCVRLKDHVDTTGGSGLYFPDALPAVFPDGTPSYVQLRLALKPTTKELTIEYAPSGGTLMGIPIGGAKSDVWVALSKGSDPITYDYATGTAVSTAKAILKGQDEGNGYRLVLSGDCISQGDLVFQFLNKSASGGKLTKIVVTQSATVTNTEDNFTGCTSP